MTIIRYVVELARKNGKPEDKIINVFHTSSLALPDASLLAAGENAIVAFYNSMDEDYSPAISRATLAHLIKSYSVIAGQPGPADDFVGSPLRTTGWNFLVETPSTGLPAETAIRMSFSAALTNVGEEGPGGTRPASRKRGGVYLGPFTTPTMEQDAFGETYVGGNFRTKILNAAAVFANSLNTSGQQLAVYSRMNGTAAQVKTIRIDNAFDTQRRRGNKRTNFASISVNP